MDQTIIFAGFFQFIGKIFENTFFPFVAQKSEEYRYWLVLCTTQHIISVFLVLVLFSREKKELLSSSGVERSNLKAILSLKRIAYFGGLSSQDSIYPEKTKTNYICFKILLY